MIITPAPAILPTDFYVYEHRKATTGEVFYVGKGRGNRAWFLQNRSKHWRHIAAKHGVVVRIVESGLQEWFAHELERDLIALHGRMDCGYGRLINLTDGGEGTSGRVMPEHERAHLSAVKSTPEARARISAAHTGRKLSNAAREKMSAAKKGRKQSASWAAARAAAMNRPEVKEKLRAAQLGVASDAQLLATGARRIACVETGVEYRSMSHAAHSMSAIGVPTSAGSIKRSCDIPGRKAGGYNWRYAE